MLTVRRYKKALHALPLLSFVVAALIHIGASFSEKSRSSYSQPSQAAGFALAPARAVALESKVPPFGGYGVLRARFQKGNPNCAKPAIFHFGASLLDARGVATMVEFLSEEILPGARSTPGMRIHAFFVSPTGQIPPALAGFQRLADLIPGGIGIITQTAAGMTFAPGQEQSAKFWLGAMSLEVSQPDPVGLFGIVIEPPLGSCGAIK